MSRVVADSSAVLISLLEEPGSEKVDDLILDAVISSVNLAEVVSKLSEKGMPDDEILGKIETLRIEAINFDRESAFVTGLLREPTRSAGFSLGDRACLSLTKKLDLPAVTSDRSWRSLKVGVRVEVLR